MNPPLINHIVTQKGRMGVRYTDDNQQLVTLAFKNDADIKDGGHVLALPIFQQQWVLTFHQERGIEFPGGKREQGETSQAAVKRELYEETGAIAEHIYYIAQYEVQSDQKHFKKDVYAVMVKDIETHAHYFETAGPVLTDSLKSVREEDKSFLLKDPAILRCVERVKELGFYQE